MISRSIGSVHSGAGEQSVPPAFNAASPPPQAPQHSQLQFIPPLQLVPGMPLSLHPVYSQGLVMGQFQRMPFTVIQPPSSTISYQQPTAEAIQQPPPQQAHAATRSVNTALGSHSRTSVADTAGTAAPDALQIFAERAEKSGIRLEALSERDIKLEAEKGAHVAQRHSTQKYNRARTSASAAANNNLPLNICSPEFIPRTHMPGTSEGAFHKDNVRAAVAAFSPGNFGSLPVPSVDAVGYVTTDECGGGSEGTTQGASSERYVADDGSVASSSSSSFTTVHIGKYPRQPVGWSSKSPFNRDASTQTVSAGLVNAGVGNSSVLTVDASTNTSHFDGAADMQQPPAANLAHTERAVSGPSAIARDLSAELMSLSDKLKMKSSDAYRWADCWHDGQRGESTRNKDDRSKSPVGSAADVAGQRDLSGSGSGDWFDVGRGIPEVPRVNVDVEGPNRNVNQHAGASPFSQHADATSLSQELDIPRLPSEEGRLHHRSSSPYTGDGLDEQDDDDGLLENVYYSDEDNDADAGETNMTDNVADTQSAVEAERIAALLAQLQIVTSATTSPAVMDLAFRQILEALTADEKLLMTQLMQQMIVLNPTLVAASPLLLQVEAMRIVLTSRQQNLASQSAGPASQQLTQESQLQNVPMPGSVPQPDTSDSLPGPANRSSAECDARPVFNVMHSPAGDFTAHPTASRYWEDKQSQHREPRPASHHSSEDMNPCFRVQKYDRPVSEAAKYHDECSSPSDLTEPEYRLPKGRGRGARQEWSTSFSGLEHSSEMGRQDFPRGRGVRLRVRTPQEPTNLQMGSSSSLPQKQAPTQPLIPPPLRSTRPDPASASQKGSENLNESWEDEIDEFGPDTFCVRSSFFKSGGKK